MRNILNGKFYIGTALICATIGIIFIGTNTNKNSSKKSLAHEYYYNEEDNKGENVVNTSNVNVYISNSDTNKTKKSENIKNIDDYIDDETKGDIIKLPDTIDTLPESITVFVNKEYGLPSEYTPSDLVQPNIDFNIDYYDEKKLLRQEAANALEELFANALENDLKLYGVSGYRSYERQTTIYNNNIKTKGYEHTNQYSAKPGYSEHQTGLSIDVSAASVNYALNENFANTDEGLWLARNAHNYGFIIRYPKGKETITGYAYEPWHIRYIGIDIATYLYENDMTLEEYYNYEPKEEAATEELVHDNDVEIVNEPINKTPSNSYSNQINNNTNINSTIKDNDINIGSTIKNNNTNTVNTNNNVDNSANTSDPNINNDNPETNTTVNDETTATSEQSVQTEPNNDTTAKNHSLLDYTENNSSENNIIENDTPINTENNYSLLN